MFLGKTEKHKSRKGSGITVRVLIVFFVYRVSFFVTPSCLVKLFC